MLSHGGTHDREIARTECAIFITLYRITLDCVLYNPAHMMKPEEKEMYMKMKKCLCCFIIELYHF